jgi:hypothetical protein
MAENAAARFVQHEIPQGLILGNEAALLPDGVAGRWGDTADNHVAHFAFGMGGDHMDGFAAAH